MKCPRAATGTKCPDTCGHGSAVQRWAECGIVQPAWAILVGHTWKRRGADWEWVAVNGALAKACVTGGIVIQIRRFVDFCRGAFNAHYKFNASRDFPGVDFRKCNTGLGRSSRTQSGPQESGARSCLAGQCQNGSRDPSSRWESGLVAVAGLFRSPALVPKNRHGKNALLRDSSVNCGDRAADPSPLLHPQ